MNQTLEDKIAIIRESFQAGAADFLEVSGSFRVSFDPRMTVYIYSETYDNSITARFETKEPDLEKRHHELETMRELLANEIIVADIAEFTEARPVNDRFVYTAKVNMDESVIFHETVVIGNDAIDDAVSLADADEEAEIAADVIEATAESPKGLSRAEKIIEQLETIDAKMIRQSLDMMNLKRSSNVRMALTRIFRSAGDARELMLSIENEAAKIVSESDQNDLLMIKTINSDGFLEPVIGLLYEAVFDKNHMAG